MSELNNAIKLDISITTDWIPDGGVVLTNGILLENGVDFLLLEDGGYILQET